MAIKKNKPKKTLKFSSKRKETKTFARSHRFTESNKNQLLRLTSRYKATDMSKIIDLLVEFSKLPSTIKALDHFVDQNNSY